MSTSFPAEYNPAMHDKYIPSQAALDITCGMADFDEFTAAEADLLYHNLLMQITSARKARGF
jgi:hypothetical protein